MRASTSVYDAAVIGGGFYGAVIALYLARQRGFKRICLLEREADLLQRASFNNQARVHNGYHYPRSFTTAYRSRINLPKFVRDWPQVVKTDFTKLYAIARRNSKITSKQFQRFCRETDAQLEPAAPPLKALFEPRLIEDVFVVQEYAFDSQRLAAWVRDELLDAAVDVRLRTRAEAINRTDDGQLAVVARDSQGDLYQLNAYHLFNCTYSGLNQFSGDFPATHTRLKHEITEMALVQAPPELEDKGITVMDGPFFSMMPFPSRGLHTLSHVRYTPHLHWDDERHVDPYLRLATYPRDTHMDRMIRDAARYMPSVRNAKYMESIFEIKTVLTKNEVDDGRPILFEKHRDLPGCFSILGGKIDNIYDVLEKLDAETLIVPSNQSLCP
ncbi:FAD-binding oxidoreductase [Burkholderia cepacia]|uniref:FAD-dependent oxidoreductase n=1 Tax=Burkholderia cepacia TaxID=292 RepID=UPI00075A2B76|nr:FAD-dependent oxidoreductase [Burkholderia cepacia]KVS27253.1 D amino acid oxidase (DAO) family protein [Burkholderia cepacia]MCA8123318.1 FAD-binding oxidoreductase [Burkholderia cepacia]